MHIVQRNFMRLLQAAVLDRRQPLEPMSHWKWDQLYLMAVRHDVTVWLADGAVKYRDDYFFQPKAGSPLARLAEESAPAAETPLEAADDVEMQTLSNPLLNRRLQLLAEERGMTDPTFRLLLHLVTIARLMITQGVSLPRLIMLAITLHCQQKVVEGETLQIWIRQLKLARAARLTGSLLSVLFGMSDEEIPFADRLSAKRSQLMAARLLDGDGSTKYMRYYPDEALTHFATNILTDLRNIEE